MASPTQFGLQEAQLRRLQKQNRALMVAFAINIVIILSIGVKVFSNVPSTSKIDANTILLHDPKGRVVAEIGSEPGLGADKDLYRPFMKFKDRGNDPVMTLYGTGITFSQPDEQHSTLDFLGLQVFSKRVQLVANGNLLSYLTPRGQLLVLPKSDGMNLTVSSFREGGQDESVFGVLTSPEEASMYVAAHQNEIDINADSRGTQVIRGKSQ